MFDCGRRGRRRLGNGHLGGVQVDAVGGGVVVAVGPGHRVQELDHTMEMDNNNQCVLIATSCKLYIISMKRATFIQPSGRPGTLLPISSLLALVRGSLCDI